MGVTDYVDSFRIQIQHWIIPPFIKYCLPDGLYCAAYVLIIDAIWHNDNRLIKNLIILLIPLVAICNEVLQYRGLTEGTYDMFDLICYIMPPAIYYIHTYKLKIFSKSKYLL